MKLLIDSDKNKYLLKSATSSFSTKFGNVTPSKKNAPLKSHLGKDFFQVDALFPDILEKCRKGPQSVLLKDAAIIAAFSGINSSSLVVDAGTGSGWLAAFLAKQIYPAKVISYEKNPEFIEIAKKNFELLGITNVSVKNKDIFSELSEKNIDLLSLDLPDPWNVDLSRVKISGFAVAYLPQIMQVVSFVLHAEKSGFIIEHVFESILREWKITEKISRPEFNQLGHTAFLVFARRVK